MAEPRFMPPGQEALVKMLSIPNITASQVILGRQEGPEGGRGPEDAGAILMLNTTFVDEERAQQFWHRSAELMALLADAPGFIRRFSFHDERSGYLIVFWRTAADAKAFAASAEHRAAVRDLYKLRWQYSHFSAIWEMTTNHGRMIFCDQCDGVTAAAERVCNSCGAELADVFRMPAPAVAP
jgi:heme-degrading monooxygenase HmoA